jgi:thiol-disulfide isomerase/thioredoxin
VVLVELALSMALGGCQPSTLTADWERITPPAPAPAFTLPQLDGEPVSLASLRGRVVVLEFWATWCGPCRQSIPSLEAVYRRHRDRGLTVLLVNVGETPELARQWLGGRVTAPILLDRDGQAQAAYGVESIPRLFVIDRQGRAVYAHAGYGGGLEHSLRLILQELLGPGHG